MKKRKYIKTMTAIAIASSVLVGCSSNNIVNNTIKDSNKNISVDSLGIKYVPLKYTDKDLKDKYEDFKIIVKDTVDKNGFEINIDEENYYGYLNDDIDIDDSLGTGRIIAELTEDISYIYIEENIDFEKEYDIRGTTFDKLLKNIINEDIDYDKLNILINDRIKNQDSLKSGFFHLEIPPIIVNNHLIKFGGIKNTLSMKIQVGNADTEEEKYSYNENSKGLVEISEEDKEKIEKLLYPKIRNIIEHHYKDANIRSGADDSGIEFWIGEVDEPGHIYFSSNNYDNDILSISYTYNRDKKSEFNIKENNFSYDMLNAIFDNLDYDDINNTLNKIKKQNIKEGYSQYSEYTIHFPQDVTLTIVLDYSEGYDDVKDYEEVKIDINFGDFDVVEYED